MRLSFGLEKPTLPQACSQTRERQPRLPSEVRWRAASAGALRIQALRRVNSGCSPPKSKASAKSEGLGCRPWGWCLGKGLLSFPSHQAVSVPGLKTCSG